MKVLETKDACLKRLLPIDLDAFRNDKMVELCHLPLHLTSLHPSCPSVLVYFLWCFENMLIQRRIFDVILGVFYLRHPQPAAFRGHIALYHELIEQVLLHFFNICQI